MTSWWPGRMKHPQAFGYNGIKNGMSGVSFVVGWITPDGTDAAASSPGPMDESARERLAAGL